jgi:glycosyltransferase involved in cell wall biosynthesis
LAVVLSGWPRISETFAVNELLALRRAGMLAAVFATKGGDGSLLQPGWSELDRLVHVLPDGDAETQGRIVAARLRGCGVAAVHGYFAHQPAAVAASAARRLGVPYGFSVHALDVRKVDGDVLAARAAGAAVVVSCNPDAAATIAATGTRPRLVRHGVDLDRFTPSSLPNGPTLSLLAVGRLVEKKGFEVLIDALRLLPRPVRLRVVGDGPGRAPLVRAVARHGLQPRVELLGRRSHTHLPALYSAADVVVVPSVVDRRGDRDGLPNVVLEAMASGRPVVASDVAAVATAVCDGVTGLLVPPGDAGALATALTVLADDATLRQRLGDAGRVEAECGFDLHRCGRELCRTLEQSYG